jgi:hypothetical protein
VTSRPPLNEKPAQGPVSVRSRMGEVPSLVVRQGQRQHPCQPPPCCSEHNIHYAKWRLRPSVALSGPPGAEFACGSALASLPGHLARASLRHDRDGYARPHRSNRPLGRFRFSGWPHVHPRGPPAGTQRYDLVVADLQHSPRMANANAAGSSSSTWSPCRSSRSKPLCRKGFKS